MIRAEHKLRSFDNAKILIYNDGDEYVGHLQDCEIVIIPGATPEAILEGRYRGSNLTECLETGNIPHLRIAGSQDFIAAKSLFLDALRRLPRVAHMDVDCADVLDEIEKYKKG